MVDLIQVVLELASANIAEAADVILQRVLVRVLLRDSSVSACFPMGEGLFLECLWAYLWFVTNCCSRILAFSFKLLIAMLDCESRLFLTDVGDFCLYTDP